MKRAIIISAAIILIVLIGLVAVINYTSLSKNSDSKPFYVGVTYCGNIISEAKLLVDKVKNYTNLFILQSGPLQNDTNAVNEIGDYAVNSGLSFIVYFGSDSAWLMKTWLDNYDGHWNASFLGVYFGDEPGGKMLDNQMRFYDQETQSSLTKTADRTISDYKIDTNTLVAYMWNGTIIVTPNPQHLSTITNPSSFTTYYPNGTIATQQVGSSPTVVNDPSNLQYTYEELWNARPFQSYTEAAERFISEDRSNMQRMLPHNQKITSFTSDYALYWFDYLSGYDVVLAQLGWNQSSAQDVALARGSANLQGKSWGAIITWKYNQQPYLPSGDEMYNQMRISYECGAEYVAIFNYAQDMNGPYGTLQEEHFQALQRFWNEVVQNSSVVHGGIKAEAVLVLPKDYGWGMRNPQDTIWGLWNANGTSQQIWTQLQSKLAQYGSRLDIVYDDPAYPVVGKYSQIFYWNQTS